MNTAHFLLGPIIHEKNVTPKTYRAIPAMPFTRLSFYTSSTHRMRTVNRVYILKNVTAPMRARDSKTAIHLLEKKRKWGTSKRRAV